MENGLYREGKKSFSSTLASFSSEVLALQILLTKDRLREEKHTNFT